MARTSLIQLNTLRIVASVRVRRRGAATAAALSGACSVGAYRACGWERRSALYTGVSSWLCALGRSSEETLQPGGLGRIVGITGVLYVFVGRRDVGVAT